MTVIGFPAVPAAPEEWVKPKTLEDWPWDEDLGKPYGDINGPVFENTPFAKEMMAKIEADEINPAHYKQHVVECIDMTENMGFLDGNIVKYVYRYAMKGGIDDLDKADWYLQRLRTKVRGKA